MIDDDFGELVEYDFQPNFDDLAPDLDSDVHGQDWVSMESLDAIAPLDDYQFIGDPDGTGYIAQTTPFTCAVVSQQMILNDFGVVSPGTGQPLSEAELVYVATTNGWLHDGTSPDDMGKLLEYYGVSNHHGYGIDNMAEELRQGHKVIVGVDSAELWNTDNRLFNDFKDYIAGEVADHAIVVKGIKFDGQGEPVVVVNDPGNPYGAGNEYALSVFMDAFEDGRCHYVATDNPPPMLASHELFGSHFDPEAGAYDQPDVWPAYTVSHVLSQQAGGAFFENNVSRSLADLNSEQRRSLLLNL